MKIKNLNKNDFLILLLLILINFILSFPGMIKYIVTLLIVTILSLKYKVNIKKYMIFFVPNIVYLLLGLLISLINMKIPLYYYKLCLFLTIPFILALLLSSIFKKNIHKLIDLQFYSLLFTYIIIEGLPGESQYAFVFGAFLIYYLFDENTSTKKKIFNAFVILTLLLFFTEKRLVLVLSIIFILLFLFPKNIKKITNSKLNLFNTLIGIFLFIFIIMIKQGLAYTLMAKYHILVSGREVLYGYFNDYYNISFNYLGHGAGWTYSMIESFNLPWFGNLHNDLLMIYIDLGLYGFIIWIKSFTKWWKKISNQKSKLLLFFLFAYTIGNYASDNIIIYINYWLSLYLILFSIQSNNDSNTLKE